MKAKNLLPEPGQMVLALQHLIDGTKVKIIACYVKRTTAGFLKAGTSRRLTAVNILPCKCLVT
jgi:hypothetical protein